MTRDKIIFKKSRGNFFLNENKKNLKKKEKLSRGKICTFLLHTNSHNTGKNEAKNARKTRLINTFLFIFYFMY